MESKENAKHTKKDLHNNNTDQIILKTYKEVLHKIQIKNEKYPNICNLWKNMIRIKYENLETVLHDAEKMLNNIDNFEKDMTQKEMITILMMHNIIKNLNTTE
tara:strand:+ start:2766 stop:3074 length:309 start_codon:yes stop_codon:yes gene_type:complete